MDTSLIRTHSTVPMVSAIERFHCIYLMYKRMPFHSQKFNLPWFSFSKLSVTLDESPYLRITESPNLLGHNSLSLFSGSFCSGSFVWSLPSRLWVPTPLWPSTWLAGWILLAVILESDMCVKLKEMHTQTGTSRISIGGGVFNITHQ